jgi:hypothetical protein
VRFVRVGADCRARFLRHNTGRLAAAHGRLVPATDRATGPITSLAGKARRSGQRVGDCQMARKQRAEQRRAEQRAEYPRQCNEEVWQSRVMVITEFDAGDSARSCRRDPEVSPRGAAACKGDRLGRRRCAVRADRSRSSLAPETHLDGTSETPDVAPSATTKSNGPTRQRTATFPTSRSPTRANVPSGSRPPAMVAVRFPMTRSARCGRLPQVSAASAAWSAWPC